MHSVLSAYGPYVGIRWEFLCMHKISRRMQRAPTYECAWHRALNARSTISRRAADVHQRMTTNDKKSSYAGIRRAHTLICDGHFTQVIKPVRSWVVFVNQLSYLNRCEVCQVDSTQWRMKDFLKGGGFILTWNRVWGVFIPINPHGSFLTAQEFIKEHP